MKLYVVFRDSQDVGWDEYHAFVVVASSPQEALEIVTTGVECTDQTGQIHYPANHHSPRFSWQVKEVDLSDPRYRPS